MSRNFNAARRLSLALMLLLSVSAFMGSAVAAQGNSGNAHLCQKGGWQGLAALEDPYTPFVNQGDCVSYGAQGGEITGLIVPSVFFDRGGWHVGWPEPGHCDVFVNIADFPTGAVLVVTYWDGTSHTTQTLAGPSGSFWEIFVPEATTATATATYTNPATGIEQTVDSSNSFTCTR